MAETTAGQLRDLIDARAREQGDRTYLEDGVSDRRLTYRGLAQAVRAWETAFERWGVRPGARVAIAVGEPLCFAAAFLGAVATGRVAVPLSPDAPPVARERSLAAARVALLVRDGAVELCDGDVAGPGPAGVLLASSGSTGTPKRIMLRERQLLHVAGEVVRGHGLTDADTGYCPLPLFHVNAEVVGLLATLVAGGRLVVTRRFHRAACWEIVERTGVTWVNAVPAIIGLLSDQVPPAGTVDRVRFVRSASAPLPVPVLRRFEAVTGLPVVETYGMTEAASQITANPVDGPRKPGSVGRPVGVELVVLDAAGAPCRPGQVGRVVIRGPGVIAAYENAGRDRIDAAGWLDTGDLGHLDHDGYLFLVGRGDDVINRGGEKVFPRDVEAVLLADPRVRSAAVVGRPDPVLGEVPVAYVVAAGARRADLAADLRVRCAATLDRYQRPVLIEVLAELPTGPNGKIMHRRLRARAAGLVAA